jgi:acyl carrier protein
MVPSAIVLLESMPLNPSGKIDRRALPEPEGTDEGTDRVHVSPRNPVEQELAEMWRDVLGVEKVGVMDNFFDLGGHSLLATQLVSRVRKRFHVELSLKDLFDTPTVADVALTLASNLAEEESDEDLSEMLQELEGLSDADIKELLSKEN